MTNLVDLTSKHFLITGASSGIGREVAVLFSRLGARLTLVGRNYDNLVETSKKLCGDNKIEVFDLSLTTDIDLWLKNIAKNGKGFDGLIHAAGVSSVMPLKFMKEKNIQSQLAINLESSIFLVKAFCAKSVCALPASIVLISSIMGIVGTPGSAVYCATKAGQIGFTKAMAQELASQKIRINCVSPGFVETGMLQDLKRSVSEEQFRKIVDSHPLGLGQPSDVANAAAFLASNSSRWITGTTLVVDGGYLAH